MTHFRLLFGRMALVVALIALFPGCRNYILEDPGLVSDSLLCSPCTYDYDCAIYDPCVINGFTECRAGWCHIMHTEDLAVACLLDVGSGCIPTPYTPPMSSPDAGGYTPPAPYTPPPPSSMCSTGLRATMSASNQGDGMRVCGHGLTAEGRGYASGWANVICDVGPCTVEIVSATLHAPTADGRSVPVSSGIGWAGTYNNFFRSSSPITSEYPIPGRPNTYNVPRLADDRVLHLGILATSIGGSSEAFVVMQVRTTGDAQVQVGVDYRWNPGDGVVQQGGISDWASCNTGGTISIASARSGMNCADTLASLTTSTPAPTPTCTPRAEICGNGADEDCNGADAVCPPPMPPPSTSANFLITLPPYGTAGCTAPITARAWGPASEYSSVGSTLSFSIPTGSFEGVWWNLRCGSDPWGSRWGGAWSRTNATPGLTVRVNGADRTADTFICQNPGGSGSFWHMPLTYVTPSRIGTCP